MSIRRTVAAIAVLLSGAACSGSSSPSAPPSALTVVLNHRVAGEVVAATSVKADGSNGIIVHVASAAAGSVAVRSTRGTFANGLKSTTLTGPTGDLALTTCNAHIDATCQGTVIVTVTDAALSSATAQVDFIVYEICNNGIDDNGDGKIDCADTDCLGAACKTAAGGSGVCDSSGQCICTPASASETNCNDGKDDDCNGLIDCADPACNAQACTAANGGAGTCGSGACLCAPTAATETSCSDGKDDDCNGQIDCADAACDGRSCKGGGTCNAGFCVSPSCTKNPLGAATETSCMDKVDNDCNGKIDCAEASCDGQQCDPAGLNWQCVSLNCTDLASGYSLTVTPVRLRIPAQAGAQTTLNVTLLSQGKPLSGTQVDLSLPDTSLGTLAPGNASGVTAFATVTTDSNGKAVATFTASGTSAGAATLSASTNGGLVTASATVTMPALGQISLVPVSLGAGIQYPVMGVKDSGWQEQNQIKLQLLDTAQQPYPDGLTVSFEHQELGGSTLSTPAAACATPAANCTAFVGATASTGAPDSQGVAQVYLYSGTFAGTVSISASATAGGVKRTYLVQNIAMVGARANAASFTVVCSPENVRGYRYHNCGVSLVDDPITCVAIAQDRYGNMLGRATQVTFMAEAGIVGPVAITPQYDPTKDPKAQANLGSAIEIINTLGGALPQNVLPWSALTSPTGVAEPSVSYIDECSQLDPNTKAPIAYAHNPRDGVSTWDGPNGKWDSNTKIWTQTAVVYSGGPTLIPAGSVNLPDGSQAPAFLGTRWAAQFTDACTPSAVPSFSAAAAKAGPPAVLAGTDDLWAWASDQNLNVLNSHASYAVAVEAPGKITLAYHGLPAIADTRGFTFTYWPCDQNGLCATKCTPDGAVTPCTMKPILSNFSCGYGADVTIIGAPAAEAPDFVDWTVQQLPDILTLPAKGKSP